MFKFLRLIRLLKEIDGMAFEERAKIRVKLCGKLRYSKVTTEDSQSIEEEYYSVPIFHRSRRSGDPGRKAIHEVRHRVQHNYPEIRLFTVEDEDFPDDFRIFLKTHLQLETAKNLTPREIDAQIFDELAYPVFLAKDTDKFLQLLFHGTQPPKES